VVKRYADLQDALVQLTQRTGFLHPQFFQRLMTFKELSAVELFYAHQQA
jgi:hypothetical protein